MHFPVKGLFLSLLIWMPLATWAGDAPEQSPISIHIASNELSGETFIWQLCETNTGQILAAGQKISFPRDHEWRQVSLPQKLNIRALLPEKDVLWIARDSEIGRIKLPLTETSSYSPVPIPALGSAGEFWHLMRAKNYLVATTSDRVWWFDPESGFVDSAVYPTRSRLFLLKWREAPLVVQSGVALLRFVDGKLEPLKNPLPDASDFTWIWSNDDYVLTQKALYARQADDTYKLVVRNREFASALVADVCEWEGKLVLATLTRGLGLLEPKTGNIAWITKATGLPSDYCDSIIRDRLGRIWVGTNRGLVVFESPRFGHRIAVDRAPLLVTRQQGILMAFEDGADLYHDDGKVDHLPPVFSVTNTRRGLAVGGWGRVRIEGVEFATPGNRVAPVAELPDGRILAPTGSRLYEIRPEKKTSTQVTDAPNLILSVAATTQAAWVVGSKGMLYRSELGPELKFAPAGTLPYDNTDVIMRSLDDKLVFASDDGVVSGPDFQPVANTGGLRTPKVAINRDGFWLAGEQQGHLRVGRLVNADGRLAWETVDAKGLAGLAELQSLESSEHSLVLCGGTTVLELDSRELKPAYRLAPPALAFTYRDVRTGAATTLPAPPAELSADENSLAFSGTLAFDEFGERPRFERRLLPTESAWVPTKIGEIVSYPSLSPRTYTLEVRATHLGHTGAVATHTFTVLPPWYATRSATLAYVAVAALGFYGLYRLRTHNLRRRTAELERIVEERTHALKEASEAKTEFLASMSHEIRNPMNGVIGLVDILREQPAATPKQAETLRLLQHCADQLRNTVDDILDFSRIEAGRVTLERATFDLRDTLEAAAVTIDQHGAKITFLDTPAAGILLVGDVGKLRQIFANYLSNALKYGVPPGARVSTLLTETEGGVRLTVGVASTGPTIPKDTLDKFFDSFTRGTDAVERNIHGTGLGLAICRKFAQAMGGEVGAVSANGETTFYLNLPFARAGAAAAATVPAPLPNALPAKALAIEDEDYNRIVLGNILAKMNYTVDWATTGAEALKLAQENGYDIILTDYRLPDTNGVELTKKILTFCPDPKPAVFAVTAYSTKERREECLCAGMAGFISKPITLEKLRTTLAGWGEHNLAKISLETSRHPGPIFTPHPPSAITATWEELVSTVPADAKRAADLAHRLNNLCRAHGLIDAAEQFELLEGALERGEPAEPFLRAGEALLHT